MPQKNKLTIGTSHCLGTNIPYAYGAFEINGYRDTFAITGKTIQEAMAKTIAFLAQVEKEHPLPILSPYVSTLFNN